MSAHENASDALTNLRRNLSRSVEAVEDELAVLKYMPLGSTDGDRGCKKIKAENLRFLEGEEDKWIAKMSENDNANAKKYEEIFGGEADTRVESVATPLPLEPLAPAEPPTEPVNAGNKLGGITQDKLELEGGDNEVPFPKFASLVRSGQGNEIPENENESPGNQQEPQPVEAKPQQKSGSWAPDLQKLQQFNLWK